MSCILKINNIYNELTEIDRKISDYIMVNKKIIPKLSVAELSEKIKVSTASIVRFSKKLGYDGFSELKIELTKDVILEENQYVYISKDENLNVKNIVEKIADKNINIIKENVILNDVSTIEKIVDLIYDAKNIYIFGVGGSALLAIDLQLKLYRINKNPFATRDTHAQLTVSTNITKDDLAIVISYSGRTKEAIECTENAKENGAKVISITKYGQNEINRLSDYSLYVPNIEKNLREGAISSRMATLMLIDIIYISLIQKDVDGNRFNLERSQKTIKKFKV